MAMQPETILALTLDGPDVTWDRFLRAGDKLADILREVEGEVIPGRRGAVRWVIRTITKASPIRVELAGRPAAERIPPQAVPQIVSAVSEGLAAIERSIQRPRHFTDRALEDAKELAELLGEDLTSVGIRNGQHRVTITKRTAAHVDELIGPRLQSIGTVEGRLESVTIHGRPRFMIYDPLTGRPVRCYFDFSKIPIQDVLAVFSRRVAAFGVIRSRATGERISVDVQEFHVMPREEDLPGPEQVRGIYREQ